MTRGSLPRFDLYEELEVSRLASVEVIEAAYRALVKHHHPDVARPEDAERITRLNIARDWLTDPDRRTRYDVALLPDRARQSLTASRAVGSSAPSGRPNGTVVGATPAPSQAAAAPSTFGINSPEVRQFLADLRGLDPARGAQVRDGKAAADDARYAEARRVALIASRSGRHSEWLFARDAAAVIAKGKLGDSPLTAEVSSIVADIAGAIVVRDLITRANFELLLLPWTWRPAPAVAHPDTRRAPTRRRANDAMVGLSRVNAGRPSLMALATSSPILVAFLALATVGGAVALLNRPAPGGVVAIGSETVTPLPSGGAQPTSSGVNPSAPTVTAPPATTGPSIIDAAQLQALQRGAFKAIRELTDAALTGDVPAAEALLGATAPNLQASGLRRATFPDVAAAAITVVRNGNGFVATAGVDRLVSPDGTTWTFDYADRPIAHYTSKAEQDLFWDLSDGRHDLFLRLASATISRSGLTLRFTWHATWDGVSSDATYFKRTTLELASVTVDSRSVSVSAVGLVTLGTADRATTQLGGKVDGVSPIVVNVTVTNPRALGAGGAGPSTIETSFRLGN